MNRSGIKIKVCGMRDPENIRKVCEAGPDYLGYIFQPVSSRYVGRNPDTDIFSKVPASIKKTGVFVNEDPQKLIEICRRYELKTAQLHGDETPAYCRLIIENGLEVIKAFAVDHSFNFISTESYAGSVSCFLFDTRGSLRGGTGSKFEWSLLARYRLPVPFLLSGGITPGDAARLKELDHPQMFAVDINSGFEQQPAMKDIAAVRHFINEIRNNNEP